jgi:molecular chaperone DnaJ
MKDYYGILGVPQGANQEEIRRAYRKMARLYHPDVNQEDEAAEAKFKELTEAYEILGDEDKRRRYDLFGEGGVEPSVFDHGFNGYSSPFGDIFDIFFRRGSTHSARSVRRGSDLITVVEISLQEAYKGVSREMEIPRNEQCDDCEGSGLEAGYNRDLCPDCGGEGRTTHIRRSSFGTFSSSTSCRRCSGTGEINTHPCPSCEGMGTNRIGDKIEVKIPPGVNDGDRIRITGKGEAGVRGGLPGDLYVEIRVREHEYFTRNGNDLHAVINVGMAEAALGTVIEVPTLDGEEQLNIPPGSQPGKIFRLRGKGMPVVNSRAVGDLFLTLDVDIPHKLTTEQIRLLEEFQQIESHKNKTPSIFQRLRKAMRS